MYPPLESPKFDIPNPFHRRFQILNHLIRNPISGFGRIYITTAAKVGRCIPKLNPWEHLSSKNRARRKTKRQSSGLQGFQTFIGGHWEELKLALYFASKERQFGISDDSGVTMSKDAFRQVVNNTLEMRKFHIPSFQIYGGVAGFSRFMEGSLGRMIMGPDLWRDCWVFYYEP